ncbi:helix-turn-helix domain-containing protein [Pseudoflavonifractor phocaeensis]|uniref:helix-turn-helix domain-containing protein n=1 Tax=Pseudoflavonifractor phocaeensis TaxID=1870988 RepID=UPI001959984B|nr:helix-turn-helix transcriptional regulator [Pseudoflavonifractor phocaeensis]MBM6884469.1 helix-turn-helix transcriptional regulator [Pseudoflavonifractor phocaeensis]
MIHAYDKTYLDKARTALGRMLDFAVYDLKYDITDFFDLFLASGAAQRFEQGDYTLIVGMSGVELAYKVLELSGRAQERIQPQYTVGRSEEYWTGWALAYYQWGTALKFQEIVRCVPIQDIRRLYSPYHEMDIRQFCDKMNELYRTAKPETNLKSLRQKAGFSQRELAELSGVPVRTIQQYEQRQKNINKAQAEYLVMLAQALCCGVEDLMEKV